MKVVVVTDDEDPMRIEETEDIVAICFSCWKDHEKMIRFVDIDDGFTDAYLCVDCAKKAVRLLE